MDHTNELWKALEDGQKRLTEMSIESAVWSLGISHDEAAELQGYIKRLLDEEKAGNKTCQHCHIEQILLDKYQHDRKDLAIWTKAPVIWIQTALKKCVEAVAHGKRLSDVAEGMKASKPSQYQDKTSTSPPVLPPFPPTFTALRRSNAFKTRVTVLHAKTAPERVLTQKPSLQTVAVDIFVVSPPITSSLKEVRQNTSPAKDDIAGAHQRLGSATDPKPAPFSVSGLSRSVNVQERSSDPAQASNSANPSFVPMYRTPSHRTPRLRRQSSRRTLRSSDLGPSTHQHTASDSWRAAEVIAEGIVSGSRQVGYSNTFPPIAGGRRGYISLKKAPSKRQSEPTHLDFGNADGGSHEINFITSPGAPSLKVRVKFQKSPPKEAADSVPPLLRQPTAETVSDCSSSSYSTSSHPPRSPLTPPPPSRKSSSETRKHHRVRRQAQRQEDHISNTEGEGSHKSKSSSSSISSSLIPAPLSLPNINRKVPSPFHPREEEDVITWHYSAAPSPPGTTSKRSSSTATGSQHNSHNNSERASSSTSGSNTSGSNTTTTTTITTISQDDSSNTRSSQKSRISKFTEHSDLNINNTEPGQHFIPDHNNNSNSNNQNKKTTPNPPKDTPPTETPSPDAAKQLAAELKAAVRLQNGQQKRETYDRPLPPRPPTRRGCGDRPHHHRRRASISTVVGSCLKKIVCR
ncbi:hypothetical protein B0H63DRAFT_519062 [Podospora didyma]|uniref:Uncharacterized protein n=1 Tax=Podospora didyma TaxID=330526 RepID=A0AAE0U3T2_9PEZI|nr:hypothetical protein B0H63DRAFT_519062 [Podospora didyma]